MLSSIKPTYWAYLLTLFVIAAGYSLLFSAARHLALNDFAIPAYASQA